MLFIRKGPGLLFVRTEHEEEITSILTETYGGRQRSFMEALTEAREAETIIFITPPGKDRTCVSDASVIIHSEQSTSAVMAILFQNKLHTKTDTVHLGPGIILLRVVGEVEAVKEELTGELDAREMEIEEAIRSGESEDTILLLTNRSLTRALSYEDIIPSPLLISSPVHSLYWDLRSRGVYFVTGSTEASQWNELRINIYDAADYYEIHHKRLMLALADLDIGLVLGETWTKDHALALLSVLAYQVRLFTLEKPEKIKRILMALEYDENGKRFVDMDVYYRNRKIDKTSKAVRLEKGKTRLDLRNEIFSRLSEKTVEEIREKEKQLKKGRD